MRNDLACSVLLKLSFNMSVQVTARVVPFWQFAVKLKLIDY
jgi:hypothetical protein